MNNTARTLLLAGVAAAGFPACNEELDVTAPYQENTIVYALLDADSTTQFVKINKAFLGPDNAFVYASEPDSSEYQEGQLQAEVQEVLNGTVVNTYPLNDTQMPHDPGIFPGPLHKLYYFNATLDPSATYRIEATAKGNHVTAETGLVGDISLSPSLLALPLRLMSIGGSYTDYVLRWSSATYGKRYEVAYRFMWDEVSGSDTVSRSFTQSIGTLVANGLGGNQDMELPMPGEAFFQTVALRVGNDPNVTRRIFRGVDLIWAVAAPDLHLYLQVGSPLSGLVEERPVYTNVDNGFGLFSSRSFTMLHKPDFDANTAPELVNGQYTAGLNFCIPNSDFDCN